MGLESETEGLQKHLRYKCSKCRDIGYILQENGEELQRPKVCECLQAKWRSEKMLEYNISQEIRNKDFDNFTEDVDKDIVEIKRMCEEYAAGLVAYHRKNKTLVGAPSLGICGNSGMGKTHLIMAIANELLDKTDVVPYFFNWVSAFKDWFSHYNSDNVEKVGQIRDILLNTELLIIDDICKDGGVKEAWITEFYNIVDYRYRSNKPIIFTSEHYSELVVMLSEAVFGRLYEMTENKKKGTHYFAKCFLKKDDDVFRLNYRLRGLKK